MYLATDPPGLGQRERQVRTQQQREGKNHMSARVPAVCGSEPAAAHTVAADQQAPEGMAAEIQFREDLWREYRLEAINAGFSTDQATEYASALSSEMGLVAGLSEMALGGRGWFYQSRAVVVRRTITSGLITLTRWENSKTTGRTGAAGASIIARGFRWWNAKGMS
jgi:hypothetical protein